MERVHLDHNATTPLRPEARDMLVQVLDEGAANPSSVHGSGRQARALVDDARSRVAEALGVTEDEVIFTSGGTESNNLALFGVARGLQGEHGPGAPIRLITSPTEHAAVREPAQSMKELDVHWVAVDSFGRPDLEQVASLVAGAPGAVIVSLMAANNEVGTVTPSERVREAIGDRDHVIYHADAVQVLGKHPFDLGPAHLASFSAHKVGGPAGVGILVRRAGTPIEPLFYGGSQEAALRPGTENVASIAAASVAVERAAKEMGEFRARVGDLTTLLRDEIRAVMPDVQLNGPPLEHEDRLCNTLNVSPTVRDARTLVVRLDLEGLEISAGSACASGSIEPSHVLSAMGLDRQRAARGLRISLGRTTTAGDIHSAVEKLWRTLGEVS